MHNVSHDKFNTTFLLIVLNNTQSKGPYEIWWNKEYEFHIIYIPSFTIMLKYCLSYEFRVTSTNHISNFYPLWPPTKNALLINLSLQYLCCLCYKEPIFFRYIKQKKVEQSTVCIIKWHWSLTEYEDFGYNLTNINTRHWLNNRQPRLFVSWCHILWSYFRLSCPLIQLLIVEWIEISDIVNKSYMQNSE